MCRLTVHVAFISTHARKKWIFIIFIPIAHLIDFFLLCAFLFFLFFSFFFFSIVNLVFLSRQLHQPTNKRSSDLPFFYFTKIGGVVYCVFFNHLFTYSFFSFIFYLLQTQSNRLNTDRYLQRLAKSGTRPTLWRLVK